MTKSKKSTTVKSTVTTKTTKAELLVLFRDQEKELNELKLGNRVLKIENKQYKDNIARFKADIQSTKIAYKSLDLTNVRLKNELKDFKEVTKRTSEDYDKQAKTVHNYFSNIISFRNLSWFKRAFMSATSIYEFLTKNVNKK